ncbi:MAG: molybdate ABC transporter substrate-binding protein [Sulfurovum sp.]
MKKIIITFWLLTNLLLADKITIFGASDLKFAMDTIKDEFLKENVEDSINIVYGSSGKGMRQIENGAPYDIYFSANMDYVKYLHTKGEIVTTPKLYAIGRVVIWSKNKNFNPEIGFDNFSQKWVDKIAIANPIHAPYGEKSKQAMESIGIYKKIKSQIVFGENISITAGYIYTQAVEIGVIALSSALSPNIANGKYWAYYLIDDELHKPLNQGYGITKYGSASTLAKKFYNFMQTDKSNLIMKKFGFVK